MSYLINVESYRIILKWEGQPKKERRKNHPAKRKNSSNPLTLTKRIKKILIFKAIPAQMSEGCSRV